MNEVKTERLLLQPVLQGADNSKKGVIQLSPATSEFVKLSKLSRTLVSGDTLADVVRISGGSESGNRVRVVTRDIEFYILRLDLATRWAMGNKFFKLTKNLDQLALKGVRRVLSFGGAWSNHLLALAQTAQSSGMQSVGVVRGEEGFDNLVLQRMRSHGMRLHFISRSQYRLRHQPEFCAHLCEQLNCDSWLPEGGANELAVVGSEMIADMLNEQQDVTRVIAAVGTGATLAGIIRGCMPEQKVNGIQVVRDTSVVNRIKEWVGDKSPVQWSCQSAGHIYARPSQSLLDFIIHFYRTTGITLDPVYTAPALFRSLSDDFLDSVASGERVVFVHTGGLAGVAGFDTQFNECADQSGVRKYLARVRSLIQ